MEKHKPIEEVLKLIKSINADVQDMKKDVEIIKKYHKENLKEQLQKEIEENECIVVENKWWFQ